MKFVPIAPNLDLDIHDDPPEGWHKVAVCSRWTNPKRIRRRWPHAAVVGPLRNHEGLDLMVRNLLANPQINVVALDGHEGQSDGRLEVDLYRLFGDAHDGPTEAVPWELLGEDLAEYAPLVERMLLEDVVPLIALRFKDHERDAVILQMTKRRQSLAVREKVVVPAPRPEPTARAPHADPGERIAGDTLAAVWHQALRRILECGREVPTRYGPTRELESLVTVIRLPEASIRPLTLGNEGEKGWDALGGLTRQQLADYYLTLTTDLVLEGEDYSYGSRLKGKHATPRPVVVRSRDHRGDIGLYTEEVCPAGTCERPPGHGGQHSQFDGPSVADSVPLHPVHDGDQLDFLDRQLEVDRLERCIWLTPWQPELDAEAGKKGQPCLVGAWFRVRHELDWSTRLARLWPHEDIAGHLELTRADHGRWTLYELGPRSVIFEGYEHVDTDDADKLLRQVEFIRGIAPRYFLDLAVTFRSHDFMRGYPLNLAAMCLWLGDTARRHKHLESGTLACISHSAHLYERDWNKAQGLAGGPVESTWTPDPRSCWRVERARGAPTWWCADPRCGAEVPRELPTSLRPVDFPHRPACRDKAVIQASDTGAILRAIAKTPDGSKVIATFESETPGNLLLQVERSGLVTNTGHALWIGREIERVWGGGK